MRVLRLLLLAPGCSYPPSFLSSTLCGIFARSSFHCFSFSPCLHRLRDIHTPSFYSPPIVISRFLDTCRPRVNPAAPRRHIDPVPLIDFIHRDMCVFKRYISSCSMYLSKFLFLEGIRRSC